MAEIVAMKRNGWLLVLLVHSQALLGAAPNPRAVLEDVVWSLLNAKEFVLRR